MDLCNLCQAFDIRALLLSSAAQKPEATGNTDRNYVDLHDYRPPIPRFFPHHGSILALKISAEHGCKLCDLFWRTWVLTLNKTDFTEEWLNRNFQGQIYLGCSGWTTSRQGVPYVTLTQQDSTGGGRTLCSFEAFADRDDLPHDGQSLLGRAVYPDSASKGCISVVADWLHTCLNEHEQCKSSTLENVLPTRVIEVGNDSCDPKLVTTSGEIGTWIALSYCWGGNSVFVFNDKTISDLQRGIPVNEYPPTLRDAVLITRCLGIQYLWIDALCIKQDSAEDWAAEAAKMQEVYSGAFLTIVAANSPSTYSGIFSKRRSESERAVLEWRAPSHSGDSSKVYLRPGSELWDHTLQSSPLMSRGWTLQEGLLAPRTVSYGAQQMIWECSQYQADEGGRITQSTQDYRVKGFIQSLIQKRRTEVVKPQQAFLSRLTLHLNKPDEWWKSYSVANPYDKWYDIVEQFTGRSLTKDTDILPALSGLARTFQYVFQDVYCAGLWRKEIICSLTWNRSPRFPADKSTRFDLTRPSGYLAPSWSWASILGKQAGMTATWKTRDALLVSAVSVAKVIDVRTTPKGADPFGQVIGGELVLRTRFCELKNVPPVYSTEHEFHDETPETLMKSSFQRLVCTDMRVVSATIYEIFQQHTPCPHQHFGVLEIVRWDKAPGSNVPGMDFLLVESTERDDVYRRIGQFGMRKYSLLDKEVAGRDSYMVLENEAYDEVIMAKWKKRTVTLV